MGQKEKLSLADLAKVDRTNLPTLEQVLIPTKEFFSDEENPLKVGSTIVRPIDFMNSGRRVHPEVTFDSTTNKNKKPSKMFKAYLSGRFFTDHWVATGHTSKGIVCFYDGDKAPEDWSCFKVVAMNKKGNVAFVKPVIDGADSAEKFYRIADIPFVKDVKTIETDA